MNNRIAVWMHCLGNPLYIDDNSWSVWRSDVIPTSEPTQPELDAALAAYQDALDYGAILLESDKASIVGNEIDAATVTVTYRLPAPDYVMLAIGELEFPVYFTPKAWAGAPFIRTTQITGLISDTPGEDIVIEPVKWFCLDVPGGAPLVIEVTA